MIGDTAVAGTNSNKSFVIGETEDRYFCDWEYAKKSWDTLQTLPQLKAEQTKYAAAFDPWVEKYLKDPRKPHQKLRELKQIPMDDPICRGFDLHLMYGGWQKNYQAWLKNPRKPSTETFDIWRARNESCKAMAERTRETRSWLHHCNPLPDWRSE